MCSVEAVVCVCLHKRKQEEDLLSTETLRPICSQQLHKLENCQNWAISVEQCHLPESPGCMVLMSQSNCCICCCLNDCCGHAACSTSTLHLPNVFCEMSKNFLPRSSYRVSVGWLPRQETSLLRKAGNLCNEEWIRSKKMRKTEG